MKDQLILQLAEITNPAIGAELGTGATKAATGGTFIVYFIRIWRSLMTAGGILLIVYFLWGAMDWLNAGGEQSKIQKARDKITNSLIGLILLVSSFAIIGFVSQLFFGNSFNILNPVIPEPIDLTAPAPAAAPVPGQG